MNLVFDYYGGSATVAKPITGTFTLAESKRWINNRVVYWNKQTNHYLYWVDKYSTRINGEHGFWMVSIRDRIEGVALSNEND